MKILLAGSHGFIGTHVRKMLPSEVDVVSVDPLEPRVHQEIPDDPPTWPWRLGVCPPHVYRDVDVVVHLGAQVGVADSMTDPWRYFTDNADDTLRFMDLLRKMSSEDRPKRIVVASSMSVYGDPQTRDPITEDHPIRPASLYGLTKFDQEAMCLMFGEMLGIEVVALRFFNVYGPGQALHNPYTGVLAIFSNALLRGEAPTVYEDGRQTRDFIYVEDVADVVVRAALGDLPGGVYNVCTGVATSVNTVASLLAGALEVPIAANVTGEKRPGDIRHAVGDPSRLRAELPGWTPIRLAEGVKAYAADLLA